MSLNAAPAIILVDNLKSNLEGLQLGYTAQIWQRPLTSKTLPFLTGGLNFTIQILFLGLKSLDFSPYVERDSFHFISHLCIWVKGGAGRTTKILRAPGSCKREQKRHPEVKSRA